jgi:hypothetical protein
MVFFPAIGTVKQYIDGHDIELWQGDRRLAKFKRSGAARS